MSKKSSLSKEEDLGVLCRNISKTTLKEGSTASNTKVTRKRRHCAFCLKICDDPAKLCGGCKKRAYCSVECQKADWSVTGKGQRHKNWCGKYEYGEEDVEWEVVPVPGKGLGIVAKKFMPAMYRIIVEPVFCFLHEHPGIGDLAPDGKSVEYKFHFNSLRGDPSRDFGTNYVALRISRVNHSCKPNAGHIYDDVARVEILYAERDINPGEEICILYTPFTELLPDPFLIWWRTIESEFEAYKKLLLLKWNIICPADCFCNDPNARKLIVEAWELLLMMATISPYTDANLSLHCTEKLLQVQNHLCPSSENGIKYHVFAFKVACCLQMTDPTKKQKALEHLQAVYSIYSAISPYASTTRTYETALKELRKVSA